MTSCGASSASRSVDGPEYGDSVDEWVEATPVNIPDGHDSIEWDQLLPADSPGQGIYMRYQDELAAVEDGSPEANTLYEKMQAEVEAEGKIINTDLDGQQIFMAGFASPFSYEEEVVTEFLLVPYFGACIHVPAPPANQTIMVTLDKENGINIEDTWGSIWVSGTLEATSVDTDLATAGYTLTNANSGAYNSY